MSVESKTEGQSGALAENEIEIPPECAVIFYNDDFTTKDFVVDALKLDFNKSEEEAVFLMEKVHTEGSAVIGTYTYDIAQTRAAMTRARAKKAGFPLRVEVKQ